MILSFSLILLKDVCIKKSMYINGMYKTIGKKITMVGCGQWDLGKYSVISDELLTIGISENNDKFSYLLSQGWKNKIHSY